MRLKFAFYILLHVTSLCVFGQADTSKTRNIIWFTPSKAAKINGIAIGPLHSGILSERDQSINGLSITLIGIGILLPLAPHGPYDEFFVDDLPDSTIAVMVKNLLKDNASRNGLSISLSGDYISRMNGVTLSGFCSISEVVHGISVTFFANIFVIAKGIVIAGINSGVFTYGLQIGGFNQSLYHHGVQIGLFNKTKNLKGVQIGLWNKNKKRSLPLINW